MARAIHKLTALKIAKLADKGMHADGGGLYLNVTANGSKSWIFRYRRRDMGLGAYPAISLAKAREKAVEAREMLSSGVDPLEARKRQEPLSGVVTFDDAARRYIEANEASWRNPKHRQQWRNTLATYASPVIGKLGVRTIDTNHVLEILEPIWRDKTETASRLRGRIEIILDWCKVRGLREGENPARWRGHLSHLMPSRAKLITVEHHAALPYAELPAFMVTLRIRDALAARALELAILTATRTSEVLDATWDEIDLDNALWTIPAKRMKNKRMHRVPLSDAAMAILRDLAELTADQPFVFPGERPGKPLSNMAFLMLLRRMGRADLTAHGFRTTFRTWAAECTSAPREVAEMALSHTVGSAVERAYSRTDLFEKRRKLMNSWADFCDKPPQGNVIPIGTLSAHG